MNKTFETLLKQAGAKLQAQDFGNATKLYNQALSKHPDNAAAQMGLAMVLNRTGESAKALPILQKIWNVAQANKAKIDKATQAEILFQLAVALQQQGQIGEALARYKDAYELWPNDQLKGLISSLSDSQAGMTPFEQLLQHARQYQASGQIDEAIKAYKAALQFNPDNDRALHGLGNALREQGDLQGALPLIQQAIIMQPEVAEYHNTLGMLFQQKGEFEKAVTFHQRAININPQNPPALCNLGVAFKRLNRFEEAVAAFRQVLQINPNMPEAYNNLGNLLWMIGDLAEAKTNFEQALKLRPNYPDAQRNLDELMASSEIVAKKQIDRKRRPPARR
ncbi:MAG: tetratricopeptide repeat protein [Methylomonas sp.]|nr:tetratricopeptide repeat protein [Methylomonas sp.]